MAMDAKMFRLMQAVMRFVDRHAESKDGPGVLMVPLSIHEMKELRRALEPLRDEYKALEALGRKRIAEITGSDIATGDELAIREAVRAALF